MRSNCLLNLKWVASQTSTTCTWRVQQHISWESLNLKRTRSLLVRRRHKSSGFQMERMRTGQVRFSFRFFEKKLVGAPRRRGRRRKKSKFKTGKRGLGAPAPEAALFKQIDSREGRGQSGEEHSHRACESAHSRSCHVTHAVDPAHRRHRSAAHRVGQT